MYLPSKLSRVRCVSMQNSMPTTAISQVRRQTTVGVPENEMSFSSSCAGEQRECRLRDGDARGTHQNGAQDAALDEDFVVLSERHLQRDETGAEDREGAHNAEHLLLLESAKGRA